MNFPRPSSPLDIAWRAAWWGPARLFGWAAAARARAYRRGHFETVRVPVPVVCVGNLTVGGSGKTPVVAWLAERWRAAGRRPGILSRGYGRTSRGLTVLANRPGERLPPVEAVGDEPRWLAGRLPGVPLAIGADRARSAERLWEEFHPDVLILDDGLQHYRLHRDADLICLDARLAHAVWVEGRPAPLLPAGPWREPPAALTRGRALLLTRAERLTPHEREALRRRLSFFKGPIGAARYRIRLWEGERPVPDGELAGRPVLALSGLADPTSFEDALRRLGAEVSPARFGDHHDFSAAEAAGAVDRARREGRLLVTTEKDAQRLPPGYPARRAELVLEWEDTAWTTIVDSAIALNPSAS